MSSPYAQYRYKDTIPKKTKLLRLSWCIVWKLAFRTSPRGLCYGWRNFLLTLYGAKIGKGSRVSPTCFVWAPWNLTMGEFSVLGDDVDCYTMDKITIGSKVAVSQRSFLCTGSHDITSLRRPLITKPITLGDHVWVCAEAFIGPGVEMGTGAVAGAKATVVKNVESWKIVAGNPSRVIGTREINDT